LPRNDPGKTQPFGLGRSPWWSLPLRLAVSAGIVWWLFQRIPWRAVVETFQGTDWGWWLAAVACYALAQVVSSYRWQLLARGVGLRVSLARCVALYFVGMFFNLFLPTSMGGDVVRAWLLAGSRERLAAAALSVFSERFAGLLALMLLACAASAGQRATLPAWALLAIWGTALCGVLFLLVLPPLSRRFPRLGLVMQALSLYRHQWRQWLGVFALSLGIQAASVVQVWMLGQALGVAASLWAYAAVVPLVTLLTLLPVSVNGVGVREAFLVLLLGPAGVAEAQAVTLGLLWLTMLSAASLLGGGVYVAGGYTLGHREEERGPFRGDPDQGRTGQPAALV
jgi:uncharacterized membrane protein YbhN (UPF0104 family)